MNSGREEDPDIDVRTSEVRCAQFMFEVDLVLVFQVGLRFDD